MHAKGELFESRMHDYVSSLSIEATSLSRMLLYFKVTYFNVSVSVDEFKQKLISFKFCNVLSILGDHICLK